MRWSMASLCTSLLDRLQSNHFPKIHINCVVLACSASSNWKYGDLRAELRGKHSKLDDDI